MRFLALLFKVVIVALTPVMAYSQMWSDVKNNPDKYFVGEGTGATLEEADQMALAALVSQISVNVVYKDEITDATRQSGGKIVSDNTLFQSSIKTVSGAQLANAMQLVLEEKPQYRVARWIERKNLDRLFESRRKKYQSLIDAAMRAEEKGKIDVALRELYWAYALVRSMQFCNEEEYCGYHLMTWIPGQISAILQDLSISVAQRNGEDVVLEFYYKGKPISSLDYTYSDGGLWSNLCSVKNGLGRLEITTSINSSTYDLEVEVEYRDQADLDPEIHSVMAYVPEYRFKEAYMQIPCEVNANTDIASNPSNIEKKPTATTSTADYAQKVLNQTFASVAEEDIAPPPGIDETKAVRYNEIMCNIERAIRAKSTPLSEYFTAEAMNIYRRLIRYGNAKVLGSTEYSFTTIGDYTWARGLTMSFSFKNGKRRNFTEDVVFTFDNNGKICNIAFGLGATTTADILADNVVPPQARLLLADFIENYQTAFAMKRLDYIKSIFSEDALIIVVKDLNAQSPVLNKDYAYKSALHTHPNYQTITLDRKGYIERLERQFASKEYINLRFNATQLSRSYSNPNIYGVQIEQDYYSSNYCDHGYLFLQINLTNPDQPQILVRTWQPEPDPKFGIYNLDDFPIQRFD